MPLRIMRTCVLLTANVAFDPGAIASLRAWYALDPTGLVDGQIIDTVSDRSEAGAEDITQGSASLQPTYDAATGGWETSATGGNLLGSSLTAWKFLHGGAATVVFRAAIDIADDVYLLNTDWGPHAGEGALLQWTAGTARWVVRAADLSFVRAPTIPPTGGQMHIFAFVWDATGAVQIYQDGVLVVDASVAPPSFSSANQARPLVLGSAYLNGFHSSDLPITDALFFDEAIDAAQALNLYTELAAYRA
jgi:hypothetical protein